MDKKEKSLIIPVYINEKIVLDMLAIMEDGFSMVSQVNYTEQKESNSSQQIEASATTGSILSKLLKIDISGELNHSSKNGENESVSKEKVHTNVSLLSKFRNYLMSNKQLKTKLDCTSVMIGDFIEIEGELQKNPLIEYLDLAQDVFRMVDNVSEKPSLGNKTQSKAQKAQENELARQIKSFADELKHSGTIDFIIESESGSVVLSVQTKYLTNDNVSEIIGGRFKVLGKIIAVRKDENERIDLLRKTVLSALPEDTLKEIFTGMFTDNKMFVLPEFKTKIQGPAVIVIPIAIYA